MLDAYIDLRLKMPTNKIGIDARMIGFSGIGTYLHGLLSSFSKYAKSELDIVLLGPSKHLEQWGMPVIDMKIPIYSIQEQWSIPWKIHSIKPDILHVPHYNLPIMRAADCIVTVHDLIHLKFPEFLPSRIAAVYAHIFFHYIVPRARFILTVSEHTKKDLMALIGIPESRILVTPLAASPQFEPKSAEIRQHVLKKWRLPNNYLLYVGNLKSFKNTPMLVRAYKHLRAKRRDLPPLVLVGKNSIPQFEQELCHDSSIYWRPNMEWTDLPAIYSSAILFLFPSLYEGFGLPPLEAMACGTPVICSNRASLPEVVGNSALLIDPSHEEALVEAIERLLNDNVLRSELSQRGLQRAQLFSWSTCARSTYEVYKNCLH